MIWRCLALPVMMVSKCCHAAPKGVGTVAWAMFPCYAGRCCYLVHPVTARGPFMRVWIEFVS